MKIQILQHVPFEDIGTIREWIEMKDHMLSYTKLFNGDTLPALSEIDACIIMGGPMSVNDAEEHPWLSNEIEFIRKAIGAGKKILGICLGAQLLAKALGARVYGNSQKEIGWLPIAFESGESLLFPGIARSEQLTAFQWHGETFNLPRGATLLASSEACRNQAFAHGENVLALQFHLEMSEEGLRFLVAHCKSELVKGKYIQTEEEIVQGIGTYGEKNKSFLFGLLDRFLVS